MEQIYSKLKLLEGELNGIERDQKYKNEQVAIFLKHLEDNESNLSIRTKEWIKNLKNDLTNTN